MKTEMPIQVSEVLDNSTIECHMKCPRLAFLQYWLNRKPRGKNFPMDFGSAYHKYREVLENHFIKAGKSIIESKEAELMGYHAKALMAALDKYPEDPPPDDSKHYLTAGRLEKTCAVAYEIWKAEKERGKIRVIGVEMAFDLALPSGRRFGGRFDQLVEWKKDLCIRDFKSTSMMGRTFASQFEPNHQITGYIWGGIGLSNRKVEGMLIETVYNVTNIGPKIDQFFTTRNDNHIQQWIFSIEREIEQMHENHARIDELGYLAFPMRTASCHYFSGCMFRECCTESSGRSMDDWLEHNTVHSIWDFMNPDAEEGVAE